MRILVVSDTHGKEDNLTKVLKKEGAFDLAIHLGDAEGKHRLIEAMLSCPLVAVKGNCDYASDLMRDQEIFLEGIRTLITHGHAYGVSFSPMSLISEASIRGCGIVMYGHTHRPEADYVRGVWVLNPGSLSEPRQSNRKPSFLVLTISENKEIKPEIKFLD